MTQVGPPVNSNSRPVNRPRSAMSRGAMTATASPSETVKSSLKSLGGHASRRYSSCYGAAGFLAFELPEGRAGRRVAFCYDS